jgi:hypothetical protein
MELSPSREAVSCAAIQELLSNLWNPKVRYTMFTKALNWISFLSQIDQSIPTHPINLTSILIMSTHLRLDLPSGLFLSGYPTNIQYALLLIQIRATCPAHLIDLDFIILIILEECKLRSSSLCSFLQISVTSIKM